MKPTSGPGHVELVARFGGCGPARRDAVTVQNEINSRSASLRIEIEHGIGATAPTRPGEFIRLSSEPPVFGKKQGGSLVRPDGLYAHKVIALQMDPSHSRVESFYPRDDAPAGGAGGPGRRTAGGWVGHQRSFSWRAHAPGSVSAAIRGGCASAGRTLTCVTFRLAFDPIRRAAVLWERQWGRASGPQAMATATSVMRVQQLLLARFDAELADLGLTFARFETLVLLTFSREGSLPMSKVGERLMVHATSATNLVQRLEAAGYVERMPNPYDGRGTLAVITAAGRDKAHEGMRRLVALGFGLSALSGPERVELFRLLEKVRRGHGDFDDLQE